MNLNRFSATVALTVLSASLLPAQLQTAQLTGRITDSSGAVIPAADVAAISVERGVRTAVTSNAEGYYTFQQLDPGGYILEIGKEGFKAVRRSGIVLQVNQVARLDVELSLGDMKQTVEVVAGVPTVDSETSSIGA